MQVGSGGKAGAAHIANELPLGHALSRGDNVVGHVHIDGSEAVQMVDADIVARAARLIGGHRDGAGSRGVDGRSLIAGHINAVVHSLGA